MQNVPQDSPVGKPKIEKVNVQDIRTSSTPRSTSNSSLTKSETETYSERRRYMSDSSESEEDSVSEVSLFESLTFSCFPVMLRNQGINELLSDI